MMRPRFSGDGHVTDVVDVLAQRSAKQGISAGAQKPGTALVVTPHPLSLHGQKYYGTDVAALLPGETLAHFLARHNVPVGHGWAVALGGIDVPEAHWHRVRPKHGHLVEARRVVHQEVVKFAAVVALIYFTGGLAAGGIASLGIAGGSLAATFASGLVYMAGMALINKLLPPAAAQSQAERVSNATESPTYSLQGGRNRLRPFEPMGLVLGEPYCVPDMAGQPYAYFKDGEQYLNQVLHAGLNCATVANIRIGQTDINTYQGVSFVYQGLTNGNSFMFGSNVDTVAGALLDAPGGPGAWVVRTGSMDAIGLVVDIEGTLFATDTTTGAYIENQCAITLEYRLAGSGTWLAWPGGSIMVLVNADTKPLRRSFSTWVAVGQYEVQVRKDTANDTANGRANTLQWSALRTFQRDAGNYAGQGRVQLDIQASGQLNGALDEVNWTASASPMPYWNGAAWVTAISRANGLSNPGAILLQLARGIYDTAPRLLAGLGLPDAEIDIESFKGFMVRCAAKGFTFDYFLQETLSCDDLMAAIAAVGMGAVSWHTGKFGVIWFSESDPVESVINMAAMKAKSFSVAYFTGTTADELEYSYFDRTRNNSWQSVRVLAPSVVTVANTARQRLMGVTTEAHAALLARFAMAQNVYQRKSISCEVDLEHLTFRRGTVLALSHDVTQWGYGGRVKEAVNNAGIVTLTLDDLVPAASPTGVTTKYVGLRLRGESQYRVFGCSQAWLNLLDYSEQLDHATWLKSNATIAADAVLTPAGRGADKLVENTTNSTHYTYQSTAVSFAAGDTIHYSALVKTAERSGLQFRLFSGGAVVSTCLMTADLLTGTVAGQQGGAMLTQVVAEDGGFYRLTLEVLAGQAGVALAALLLTQAGPGFSNTYLGDGASGLYISEVQLRKGSHNLVLTPQGCSGAGWSLNSCFAITPNTIAGPSGAVTADLIVRNATVSGNWADLTYNATVGVGKNTGRSYKGSMWLWVPSGTATVRMAISDANYNTTVSAALTLTTTPTLFDFTSAGPAGGWNALGQYMGVGLSNVPNGTSLYVGDVRLVEAAPPAPYEQRPANARRLSLSTAWPGGVPVPGDSAANPAMDALWIYDFKSTPGQKLRVTEIQPQGNMEGAQITLVPESDEFWTYVNSGTYTAPPNTSLLQGPPVASGLVVTEQLKRQGNTFYTELTLTFSATGAFDHADLWGALGTAQLQKLGSTRNQRVSWQAGLNDDWALELRPYSSIHAGAPVATSYTVLGLAVPPPDVTGLTLNGTSLSWLALDLIDMAGYIVRLNFGNNSWWPTAQALFQGLVTSTPVEIVQPIQGPVTILVKAVDTSGNESANAAIINASLGVAATGTVLYTWPEAPAFSGTITGGAISVGVLLATANDLFYGPDEEAFYNTDTSVFFTANSYVALSYEWAVAAPVAGTLFLSATVAASSYTLMVQRDSQALFYGADADYFYAADADLFYGEPADWQPWPGRLRLPAAETVRMRIACVAGDVQGSVSVATVVLTDAIF